MSNLVSNEIPQNSPSPIHDGCSAMVAGARLPAMPRAPSSLVARRLVSTLLRTSKPNSSRTPYRDVPLPVPHLTLSSTTTYTQNPEILSHLSHFVP